MPPTFTARPQSGRITPITPGSFIPPNAFYNRPPATIRGIVENVSWWTAGQPILPLAPADTAPRGWQFLSEQNKIFTPRATEYLTFDDLRKLASYPLAAILINIHCDVVASRKWQIRLRQVPGQTNKQREEAEKSDTTITKLTEFFMNPNADNTWREFVRMWILECLTTDAPALYIRRDKRRNIGELRVIDGAMIARYIDDNGWTPSVDSPAYAQLWWGTPAWDLARDQLFYRPMNPRAYKLYGYPATERMEWWLKLGWARLELKTQWAENGTIPDGLMVVPPSASIEMVERQQAWMNAVMTGNPQKRVQLRLIQGFSAEGKDQLVFPKEKMLTDEYDDLEIRQLCGGYGVSKQRFLQQVNRASAEMAQEAAEQEGTWPSEQYIMDSANLLIQSPLYFGLNRYEFTYQDQRDKDPSVQSTADATYQKIGAKTLNEIRDSLGLDPIQGNPWADQPMVLTANGVVPYSPAALPEPKEGNEEGSEGPSKPVSGEIVPANKPPKVKMARRAIVLDAEILQSENRRQIMQFISGAHEDHRFDKAHVGMTIDPHHYSLHGEQARNNLQTVLDKHLRRVRKDFVAKLKDVGAKKVRKADDDYNESEIRKLLGDDEFWTTLWIDLPDDLKPDLEAAVRAGMAKGLLEANISGSQTDMINSFNAIAQAYAKERAAEMVGMKFDDAGELVPNPKAQYVISDTTRDDLRRIITQSFEQNTRMSDLVKSIQDAGAFSTVRAQMIAATEVSRAQAGGTYDVWKHTGVVQSYRWQNSNLSNVCADCIDNAEEGEVAFGKTFPSGDLYPPAHPNCRCVIVAVKTGTGSKAA